jgi:ATP-dependent helicase/nuclease subunit A
MDAIDVRWRTVTQPTYAVQAIKELAIKGGRKPHGAEAGGAEWGEVLHILLDAAMKHPTVSLKEVAVSTLETYELPGDLTAEAVRTVERVMTTQTWRRAQQAVRLLTEVPLALPVAATESATGLPTVLRGVIDLVFLESAGWVIVDYKSERVDSSEIPALVDFYKPQLEIYAAVWEKVVRQPVVERGLLFAKSGEYRIV